MAVWRVDCTVLGRKSIAGRPAGYQFGGRGGSLVSYLALCPAAAATIAAVAVAMPLILCMKLRQMRSAIKMDLADPVTTPNSSPYLTEFPSVNQTQQRQHQTQQQVVNNGNTCFQVVTDAGCLHTGMLLAHCPQ
jgi:hypothetical protein